MTFRVSITEVETHPVDLDRSSVAIISRIPDRLKIRTDLQISAQLNSIVRLEDLLVTVIKMPVTQEHRNAPRF